MIVYDKKEPRLFWRIAIVTRLLHSIDSGTKRAILRITKTNTILKRPINKLFSTENTYQDTKQTGKAREQRT